MSLPSAQRFIGVDLGTTNSSVCYTRYNTGLEQFDDPTPVRFGNDKVCRSMLLLDAAGQMVVASGEDVFHHIDFWHHPDRVHQEFKLALGEDREAAAYTRLLAEQLLTRLQQTLHTRGLVADEHATTVGVPAKWLDKHPERVGLVESAVEGAGFPNVKAVSEPIAAMYYHAFLGDMRFENRPQRWLVVDIGGGTSDLAIIETSDSGARPEVLYTYGERFGGTDFDRLLLERLVLERHWEGAHPPAPEEWLGLVQFVRRFKEKFSEHVNRERRKDGSQVREFRMQCPVANVRNPVTLTYDDFTSDALCRPLIDRFRGILNEAVLRSGYNAREIDRVILTGGSARWYFVRETADAFLGWDSILSRNPELTIAGGLALARTGFRPPGKTFLPTVAKQEQDIERLDLSSFDLAPVDLDPKECRKKARSVYRKYTAGGAGLAVLVSPIPGASSIPLAAVETKMTMGIAKVYGYDMDARHVAGVVGGLLAGGAVLKIAAMEVMTLVPGLGWIIKGGIAGTAMAALGEAAIAFFEKKRFAPPSDDRSLVALE